jgi:hypothetical protein
LLHFRKYQYKRCVRKVVEEARVSWKSAGWHSYFTLRRGSFPTRTFHIYWLIRIKRITEYLHSFYWWVMSFMKIALVKPTLYLRGQMNLCLTLRWNNKQPQWGKELHTQQHHGLEVYNPPTTSQLGHDPA